MRSKPVFASILLLIILGGCSSSGEAPIRYYVVEPVEQEAMSDQVSSVQIVDLHIPQYLERFQMVMRSGSNELIFSDSHQWGENLRKNLLRVLSINLSALLGTPEVSTPLTRSRLNADIKVKVFIERFDQTRNGHIILKARYQLVHNNLGGNVAGSAPDKRVPRTYAFSGEVYNPSERSYVSMVAYMGQLFNELSTEIARHLIDQETQ